MDKRTHRIHRVLVSMSAGAMLIGSGVDAHGSDCMVVNIRAIAVTGEQAAGAEAGVLYEKFGPPRINASGDVLIRGQISGAGVTENNNKALWISKLGTVTNLVRTGSAAPEPFDNLSVRDLTGDSINYNYYLDDAGRAVFPTTLPIVSGPSRFFVQVWWSARSDDFRQLTRKELTQPDLTEEEATGVFAVHGVNSAGSAAFRSLDWNSVLSGTPESIRAVARVGQRAPGTPAGVTFTQFSDPAVNSSGGLAFHAFLTGAGGLSNEGYWAERGGSLRLIARKGSPAPGGPAGFSFRDVPQAPPVYNSASRVAMLASASGGGLSTSWGVWTDARGQLEAVAIENLQAPIDGEDVVFDRLNISPWSGPSMNAAGDIVFIAWLRGPDIPADQNHSSIWLWRNGEYTLIARSGDPAPGAIEGAVFGGFGGVFINNAGDIAFLAGADCGQVDENGDPVSCGGLYLRDSKGTIRNVVQRGESFSVHQDGFDHAIVSETWSHFYGSAENGDGAFNDSGELAFRLRFEDGREGVYVARVQDAPPVPGDILGSGVVNSADLGILLSSWGASDPVADLNGDGIVNVQDLAILLGNFGRTQCP